ncbi:TPA: hypothetical protein MIO58_11130 [Klebsiella pneumoniae subsp. pneumoniae]|nr:hypothetical protein [Klebsiella pneumoniae subsp. pneumoniae]
MTIEIPEVLIGEFFRYALRTERLTPTCADAQVFFIPKIPPLHCFPMPSRVTCFDSSTGHMELLCFWDFSDCCSRGYTGSD